MCRALVSITFCSLGAAGLVVTGCESNAERQQEQLLEIDLDKKDPRRLLTYYLSSYVDAETVDSMIVERGRRFFLQQELLEANVPQGELLVDAALSGGKIDWDEFAEFVDRTYYEARELPVSIESVWDSLRDDGTESLFKIEVNGVMTTARRRITVADAAVRAALTTFRRNNGRLVYPVGTIVIGEHVEADSVLESTVMRKRGDADWDFAVYNASGERAPATLARPRALKAPTQCIGCHFGTRLFEPEKSFPVAPRRTADGERKLWYDQEIYADTLVSFFDEHRRRDDTVLGLYGTVYTNDLISRRRAGTASGPDLELLAELAF